MFMCTPFHCHVHPIPLCTQAEYRGFVCSLFVESLDLLVASALDGNICETGVEAVHVYTYMKHT